MVDTAEFERDLLARIVQNIKPSKAAIFSGQNYQMSVSHGVETDQDELNMELVEKVVQTEGPVSDKVHKRQLAVPYKNAEGKVLGVMYVEIAAPRRLKFRDLAILQGLGRQMVERHWQPTKAPESSLNPETLSEVTRYVRSTLSIVSSVLKPQRVLILVRFEDGPKIVASRGFDDVQNLSEVPFSRELVDSIWEKGETCHIRDAANDPQYSKFAGVKEHSLRSVCVCPLNKLDGEDRGLIYLDSCKDPAEFLTAEVSILQRLALALEKDLARVLAPESDLEADDVLGSSSSSILDNDNEYSLPDVSSYLDEPDSFVVNDSEETDPTDEAESISDDYHSSALFEEEEKLDDEETEEPEPEEGEAEEPVEEAEEQREDESAEELADEADEFDDEAEETEVAEEQLDDDQVEELANEADEFDDEADQQPEEVVDEEADVAEEQLDDQQVEEPDEFDDQSDEQAEEVDDEEAEVAEEQLDDQQVEEPEEFDDESDDQAEEVDDEEAEVAEEQLDDDQVEELANEADEFDDESDERAEEVDDEGADVAEEQLDDEQVEEPDQQFDDDEGAGEDPEEQVEGGDAPEEEAEELDETVDEEVAEEAEDLDDETTETAEHVDEDGELDQDSDELEQPEPTFEDTESAEHAFDDEEDEESDEEEPESEPTVEQQGESSPPPLLDLYDGSPLNGDTEYQYEPSENDLVTITLPPQLLDDPEEEEEEADSDEIEPTVEETAPPFQREEDSEVDSVRALPVDATVEVSAEIAARALAGVRALQKQQETDDEEVEQAAEDSELEDEADTHVGEPEADSEEVDDDDDEADGEEDSEETDEDEESDTEDNEESEEESDDELKDDADTHVGKPETDSEEADNDEEEAAADGEDDEDDSYDADEEETEADTELEDDADSHVGKTESKSEEVDDEEAPTEGEDDEGEDEEDADDEDDVDLEEVEESETDTELPDDADSHVGKTEADSEEVDEQDESDEEEDSEDEDSDEEADSGDDEDSAEEEDELEEEEPQAAEPSTAPPAAAAPVKSPAEVAEQEESLMKYVERGLQAVTPAKKATFWERLKWVFSPESVPQGGDYSHIHIAGKVVLQDNDWKDDEPIEVTLGFPSHNMTVILEIAKGEADYAYHGRFEGDSPVWFEVTVEKPGYFPIKLSKVTFKAGDVDGHGEPATRVHEITLIPRKD